MSFISAWLRKLAAACAACTCLIGCYNQQANKPLKWAAYYGSSAPAEVFAGYDVLVFDADSHPPLAPIQAGGARVLAYLSVSEIAPYRTYAARFAAKPGFVLGTEPRWGAAIVDIRDAEWQAFLLQEIIPSIMQQGFDGIMIDTLDSALHTYQQRPDRLMGTQTAIIDFVSKLRQEMPRPKWIMVNRGFEILPDISENIDAILAESILVDAREAKTTFFAESIYLQHVQQLQKIRQENQQIQLFSLDYLATADIDTVEKIVCTQRDHGFSPYIASMDLQDIPSVQPCI